MNTSSQDISFSKIASKPVWRCASHALLVAAVACGALLSAAPVLRAADPAPTNGNLLIEAKAEVEVYHNGHKIVLRDESKDKQHYLVKVPERAFKAGDVIVLHARSPFVYRGIVVAINLMGKAGQIPVKKSDWRFLGEAADPRKITAADVQACKELLASMSPDPEGETEREKLGILPESKGGSEWVRTEKRLNGWYCVGFVLTDEMLKAPKS